MVPGVCDMPHTCSASFDLLALHVMSFALYDYVKGFQRKTFHCSWYVPRFLVILSFHNLSSIRRWRISSMAGSSHINMRTTQSDLVRMWSWQTGADGYGAQAYGADYGEDFRYDAGGRSTSAYSATFEDEPSLLEGLLQLRCSAGCMCAIRVCSTGHDINPDCLIQSSLAHDL